MKLVYSITCHESLESIVDQVKNYLYFNKEAIIIIHINKDCDDLFLQVKSNYFLSESVGDRVFINENRVSTSKSDYNLHCAHILNLKLINRMGIDFDYFILEASNSLMILNGVSDYISEFDIGLGFGKVNQYWADKIRGHASLVNFISDFAPHINLENSLLKGCHEGAFFSSSIVGSVFGLVDAIDSYCRINNDPPNYPTEEVWFQVAFSILKKSFPGIKVSGTTTYLPWERNLKWTEDQVIDVINNKSLPKGKFSIKRIERDTNNTLRKIISEKYNFYLD